MTYPHPQGKPRRALKEVEVTLQRAEEALEYRERMMLNAVVQGSTPGPQELLRITPCRAAG